MPSSAIGVHSRPGQPGSDRGWWCHARARAARARAFEMLRRYSRNNHHRLVDVALAVLADPTSHPALTHPRR